MKDSVSKNSNSRTNQHDRTYFWEKVSKSVPAAPILRKKRPESITSVSSILQQRKKEDTGQSKENPINRFHALKTNITSSASVSQQKKMEDDNIQMKAKEHVSDKPIQEKGKESNSMSPSSVTSSPNNTGLPDQLKSGIENLSGYSMDDVRVHYNSESPAKLRAHAYAQGSDIHMAPGQEKHLPHEAWHVVQQKQGRVKPDIQKKNTAPINDDVSLENEADVMGTKALHASGEKTTKQPVQLKKEGSLVDHSSKAKGNHVVQRLINTNIPNVIANAPGALHVALNNIDGQIIAYNNLCQNMVLAPQPKMQQQFDALRDLQQDIYPIMNQISTTTLELSNDPTAQALHTLHGEIETEHRQLVTAMVNNPGGHNNVIPFDTTGMTAIQITQARALWDSMMNGNGKIKLVGNAANQEQVRSWLTQLMDTPHGKAMLAQLDAPDNARGQTLGDDMSNVYIGEDMNQLPNNVSGDPNFNPMMQNNPDPQAQPLNPEAQTKVVPRPGGGGGFNAVNDPGDFIDEVQGGSRGVSLNGNEYDFGVGSGSFVNMNPTANLPTSAGPPQALGPNGAVLPTESYMPDWLLLGHELGHSLNMRTGAATSARKNFATPMSDFSASWSGDPNAQTREGNWYGGSEEYINIIGNENQLRQESGLDQRTGHTSPKAPLLVQRGQAITQAITLGNWMGNCGAETLAINNEYTIVLNNHITPNLTQHTTQAQFNQYLIMAQRFNNFATAWMNLRIAHDAASKTKQFGLYAWWKKAKDKIAGTGNIIVANNVGSYTNRVNRIINLEARY